MRIIIGLLKTDNETLVYKYVYVLSTCSVLVFKLSPYNCDYAMNLLNSPSSGFHLNQSKSWIWIIFTVLFCTKKRGVIKKNSIL